MHTKRTVQNHRGFTLIEILIVIGIIAILAGIVLVAINPARQFRQANNAQRESNVNAILNAIGQYTVDNKGTLPPEIQGDEDTISGVAGDDDSDLCDVLVPKYLPALPVDPLQLQTDADLIPNDQSITEDECDDTYLTGYSVEEEAGRVIVRAPQTEDEDNGGVSPDPISVTR
jgi:type IV pilus assembly protein PilA